MSFRNSRLIVKNLGKNVTAEELQSLFSKEGVVTDLRLKYKKDGTFRHFAFIGFKTSAEAKRALNSLNNARLDDCNISVELCKTVSRFYVRPGVEEEQEEKDHEDSLWGSVEIVHQLEAEKEKPTEELPEKLSKRVEAEKAIADSRRIFLRNLCYSCTAKNIRRLFKDYGPLEEVYMPMHAQDTTKNRGFAFVSFVHPSRAVKAYYNLDGTEFQGRVLHLIPGQKRIMKTTRGIDPNAEDSDLEDEEKEKTDLSSHRNSQESDFKVDLNSQRIEFNPYAKS